MLPNLRTTDETPTISQILGRQNDTTNPRTNPDTILAALRNVLGNTLAEPVAQRVARATADGLLSRSELKRILSHINNNRRTIKSPAAYFVRCAQELFRQAGLPW